MGGALYRPREGDTAGIEDTGTGSGSGSGINASTVEAIVIQADTQVRELWVIPVRVLPESIQELK